MTRYADPQRCPDCLSNIEYGTTTCPSCRLSLSGALASQLFATLAHADELLDRLRPAGTAAATTDVRVQPSPSPTHRVLAVTSLTRGLSAASVPKILLGLGALCLLVAALFFLAVTWSVMGVAGRTGTLVGFTVVAGGVTGLVARQGLRAAAESLGVVALGLLAFDLVGARDSGWFGDMGGAGFLLLLGLVLLAVAGAAGLAVRRTSVSALVGVEIVGVLGAATAVTGFLDTGWLSAATTQTVAVALAALVTFAAHRLRLVSLTVGSAILAGLVWLSLAASAFERAVANPTARELWLGLEAWPMLAAAALVGAATLARGVPLGLRVLSLTACELVLATVVLIPFAQGTVTEFTLALLLVLVLACALAWFAPASSPNPGAWVTWAAGLCVTPLLGAGWLALVGGLLLAQASSRLLDAGSRVWEGTFTDNLPGAIGGPEAWLLPFAAAGVLMVLAVLARSIRFAGRLTPVAGPVPLLAVCAVSMVATLACYPAPVVMVMALLLLGGIGFAAWSLRAGQMPALAVGTAFVLAAVVVSLHDEGLTAIALVVTLALAGAVHLRWKGALPSVVAGAVLAVVLSGSVWTLGALVGANRPWVALTALVLLGVLVVGAPVAGKRLWRGYRDLAREGAVGGALSPQSRFSGVEVGALTSGLVVAVAGVAAAPYDLVLAWTAGYLTAGGVFTSALALLRPDRRPVGWLGGLLLAAATWVRLWDTGVDVPEAYTFPSALALAVAGIAHLLRHPGSSTFPALAPSLGLALVPSLLWVLWEPLTLRSILLGLGCLALLLGGLRLRWTAPVVLAATVGALLVLRHLGTAADMVPQWVLIGTAGTLLVGLGITWEHRVREAKALLGHVRALR
ncbi:MAG: hypothetical protein M3393_04395 [Actinomycetota bacterium]|nr:hypothetical protein [Actinomycetota bacterium]